ncbi:MAG: Muconate cycloisomerase [Subtercola sp.]|nr:Muconate cycloisomerase [Subtercola sp.]
MNGQHRIERIEVLPFAIPLTGTVKFATGTLSAAEHLLVTVHTDSGVTGTAEAIPRPMIYGETGVSLAYAIETLIAPALMGMSIFETAQIEHRLRHLAGNVAAKSSVEIAIFDAIGNALGVSCHSLLGGFAHDVRCTAILGSGDAATLIAEVDELHDTLGITSLKVKVGLDVTKDIELVTRVREHSPQAVIYVDANHGFTAAEAIRFVRATEGMLDWIEEPCAAEEVLGRAAVVSASTVPVLGDESCITTREVVNEVLGARSSMIGLKLQRTGITQSQRIREFCTALGVPVLVASQGDSGIGTNVSASFAAAQASTATLPAELAYFLHLENDLMTVPPVIRDGRLAVSSQPGFGIAIDKDTLNHYRTDKD